MPRDGYARTIDGSKKVRLERVNAADTDGVDKPEGMAKIEDLGEELAELENLLTYAGTHALLVVLQGRDASGKDGAARKILEFTNVQNAYVHAFKVPTARGSSVFALSENGATSAAAGWLAQKENAADLIGGVNLDVRDPVLARTLLDLSQTAQINDSLKVGRHVLEGIRQVNPLHKPAVEQAGFAVLKAPDIPSILVETAFISNPDEEQKLRSDRHQKSFAESIHGGIRRYFAQNPPLARVG